ncbi:hypothetical protein LCGC14_2993450, partial [marine sediment metagenome]
WISDSFNNFAKEYNRSMNYTQNLIQDSEFFIEEIAYNGTHFFMAEINTWVYTDFNQSYPNAPYMEIGNIDGTREYSFPTLFLQRNNRTDDFSTSIQSYLTTCTADSGGFCNVPIYLFSTGLGILQLSDLLVNYTYNINPIQINMNMLSNFLTNSTGFVTVPIKFSSSTSGILQVNELNYDHSSGNDTIAVIAHNLNYTAIKNLNLTMYFSDYDLDFPKNVQYLEFIPSTPTTQDVVPFGQTPLRPILNLSTLNYGHRNMDLSLLLNETFSCVDLYTSQSNIRPTSSLWDGLLGYWPFDLDARDISGNNNDGIVTGANHTRGRDGISLMDFETTSGFSPQHLNLNSKQGDYSLNTSTGISTFNIILT